VLVVLGARVASLPQARASAQQVVPVQLEALPSTALQEEDGCFSSDTGSTLQHILHITPGDRRLGYRSH
jgi:hypothetical protein